MISLWCVSVEDVSDLWPTIKNGFEKRFPLKRACLNNKTRNPIYVDYLPAEFILTRDARLRSRFPQEQYLFWFREPYATVVLVTCEVRWKILDLIDFFQLLSSACLYMHPSAHDTVYNFSVLMSQDNTKQKILHVFINV